MIHKQRKRCRKCPVCHQYIEVTEGRYRLEFKFHTLKNWEFCRQTDAGTNKQKS